MVLIELTILSQDELDGHKVLIQHEDIRRVYPEKRYINH